MREPRKDAPNPREPRQESEMRGLAHDASPTTVIRNTTS
jgi:hypothetical protein